MDLHCRLCGKKCLEVQKSIVDHEIQEMFNKCNIFIDKEDKNLSQVSCMECLNVVFEFSIFLDVVSKTQEILKKRVKEEILSEESDTEAKIDFLDSENKDLLRAGDKILIGQDENIIISTLDSVRKKTRVSETKKLKSWKKYSMAEIFEKQLIEGKSNKSLGHLKTLEDEVNSDGSLNEKGLKRMCHIKWSEYSWSCLQCSSNFYSRQELGVHSRQEHKTEPKYKCNFCSKNFVIYSAFHNHLISQHDSTLKFCCLFCSKFFCDLVSLYKHQLKDHETATHFCLYCGLVSKTSGKLKDHVVSHLKPEEIGDMFTCDICMKMFKTKKFVRAHIMLHLTNKTGKKNFICHVCGKSFFQKKYLYGHRLVHQEERPFQCEFCPKNYKSKRELGQHYLARHPEKNHDYKNKKARTKKYNCDVCRQGFMSLKVMIDHKNTHLGVTPHQCVQCGKQFSTLKFLRLHQARHTSE